MNLFFNYTNIVILCGTIMLSIATSFIGIFMVLKRQSLLGDVISHAALPGIVIALLIMPHAPLALVLIGGSISSILGTWLVTIITKKSSLCYDTALGVILASFFGAGLMLMTILQRYSLSSRFSLTALILGNITTLTHYDVITLCTITVCTLMILFLCWKELIMQAFDPTFTQISGYCHKRIQTIHSFIALTTILIGIHLMGIMLITSMLIAPAAAALQWSKSLHTTIYITLGISILSCYFAIIMCTHIPSLPPGPVITIIMSSIVFASLVLKET